MQVPKTETPKVDIVEPDPESDSDSEDNDNMTITVIDFINFATKVVPENDGSPSENCKDLSMQLM